MSAQAAMEIINEIATRLGVAAEYIIPEFARMNIAQHAISLVALLCMAAISILYLNSKRAKDSFRDDYDDPCGAALTFFSIVAVFVCTIGILFEAYDLVGWIASPTAKTIVDVVRLMR